MCHTRLVTNFHTVSSRKTEIAIPTFPTVYDGHEFVNLVIGCGFIDYLMSSTYMFDIVAYLK